MSTPTELSIGYNASNTESSRFVDIFLGKHAAGDLFDYLHPKMAELAPGYEDEFEGLYYGEDLSIRSIPEAYFQNLYHAIMDACQQIDSLKPYQAALQKALEEDDRFSVID